MKDKDYYELAFAGICPESIDFENTKQLAKDCWLFFKGDKQKKTISKEAFLHEVGAMLESVKQHYEKKLTAKGG